MTNALPKQVGRVLRISHLLFKSTKAKNKDHKNEHIKTNPGILGVLWPDARVIFGPYRFGIWYILKILKLSFINWVNLNFFLVLIWKQVSLLYLSTEHLKRNGIHVYFHGGDMMNCARECDRKIIVTLS